MSWSDWVDKLDYNKFRTPAHGDHLRMTAALAMVQALLRRSVFRKKPEEEKKAVERFVKWASGICAVNVANGLDTDRLFSAIFDPEAPFWRANDKRRPFAEVQGMPPIQNAHSASSTAAGAGSTSRGPSEDDVGLIQAHFLFDVTKLHVGALVDLWPSSLEVANPMYHGPPLLAKWVQAKIVEVSPFGTEARVAVLDPRVQAPLPDNSLWVGLESHRYHIAPPGCFTAPNVSDSDTLDEADAAKATAGPAPETAAPLQPITDIISEMDEEEASWRSSLSTGCLVDAMDRLGKWFRAIIVDTAPAEVVAAAAESESGQAKPAAPVPGRLRVSFIGWSSSQDEWIQRSSNRIARLNLRSAGATGIIVDVPWTVETDQERDCEGAAPLFAIDEQAEKHSIIADRPYTPFSIQKGPILAKLLNEFFCHPIGNPSGGVFCCFNALMNRLLASGVGSTPHITMQFWTEWTPVLGRVADLFTSLGIDCIVKPFISALIRWIADGMTADDVKAMSKQSIDGIASGVYRLTRRFQSKQASGQVAEEVIVLLVQKALKSEATMKRRDALKMLQDLIAMATNAQAHPNGVVTINAGRDYARVPVALYLRPGALARWLSAQDITLDMFVTRHHGELVRQAGGVLTLLASHGLLTEVHASHIWSACDYSAEEDVKNAVAMIAEVASSLPPVVLQHLLDCCIAAGGTRFPQHTAKLLQSLVLSQQRVSELPLEAQALLTGDEAVAVTLVRRSLACLFALTLGIQPGRIPGLRSDGDSAAAGTAGAGDMTSPSSSAGSTSPRLPSSASTPAAGNVSAALSAAAQSSLLGALQHSALAPFRMPYMRACVRNVSSHVFVPRSLAILRGIIDTFPPTAVVAPPVGSHSTAASVGGAAGSAADFRLPDSLFPSSAPTKPTKSKAPATASAATSATSESKEAAEAAGKPINYTPADVAAAAQELLASSSTPAPTDVDPALSIDTANLKVAFTLRLLVSTPSIPGLLRVQGASIRAVIKAAVDAITAMPAIAGVASRAAAALAKAAEKQPSSSPSSSSSSVLQKVGPPIPEVIDQLQREHGVVDVLLGHINAFCNAARRTAEEMGISTWASLHDTTGHADSMAVDNQHAASGVHLSRSDSGGIDPSQLEATAVFEEVEVCVAAEDAGPTAGVASSMAIDSGSNGSSTPSSTTSVVGFDPVTLSQSLPSVWSTATAVPFGSGIRAVLEFLGQIIARSHTIALSRDQALLLWDSCVAGAITQPQRTHTLSWFIHGVVALAKVEGPVTSSASDSPASSASAALGYGLLFDSETAQYLFAQRLNTPSFADPVSMDHTAFTAWRSLFLYHGGKRGQILHSGMRIAELGCAPGAPKDAAASISLGLPEPEGASSPSNVSSSDSDQLRLAELDPLGMDTLWSISLQARDSAVASAAVYLLTLLQQRVSGKLAGRVGDFRRRYVARCMDYIRRAVDSEALGKQADDFGWPWDAAGGGGGNVALAGHAASASTMSPSRSAAAAVGRSTSSGSTTSLGSTSFRLRMQPDQLVQRCVSLIDGLLDESEEETAAIMEAIRTAVCHAHLFSAAAAGGDAAVASQVAKVPQLANLVSSAREALTYSSHASDAGQYLEASSDGGGGPNSARHSSSIGNDGASASSFMEGLRATEGMRLLDPEASIVLKVRFQSSSFGTAGTATAAVDSAADAKRGESDSKQSTGVEGKDSGAGDEVMQPASSPQLSHTRLKGEMCLSVCVHERLRDVVAAVAGATGLPSRCLRIRFLTSSSAGAAPGAREAKGSALGRTIADLGWARQAQLNVVVQVLPDNSVDGFQAALQAHAQLCGDLRSPAGIATSLQYLLEQLNSMPARLMAADTSHISMLLSLVDGAVATSTGGLPAAISQGTACSVWRLLCRLPTAPRYLQAVLGSSASTAAAASEWAALLPPQSTARLLYGSLLVRNLVTPRRPGEAAFDSPGSSALQRYLPPVGKGRADSGAAAAASVVVSDITAIIASNEAAWRSDVLQSSSSTAAPATFAAATFPASRHPLPSDADAAVAAVTWQTAFINNGGFGYVIEGLIDALRGSGHAASLAPVMKGAIVSALLSSTQRYVITSLTTVTAVLGSLPMVTVREGERKRRPQSQKPALPVSSSSSPSSSSPSPSPSTKSARLTVPEPPPPQQGSPRSASAVANLSSEYQLPGLDAMLHARVVAELPTTAVRDALLQYLWNATVHVLPGQPASSRSTVDIRNTLQILFLFSALVVHQPSVWSSAAVGWAPTAASREARYDGGSAFNHLLLRLVSGSAAGAPLSPAAARAEATSSAPSTGEANAVLKMQCAAVCSLYAIAIHAPTATGASAALPTAVIAGPGGQHPHPHAHLRELLLRHRPRHSNTGSASAAAAVPASSSSGSASLYFALTELLLRDTIDAIKLPVTSAPMGGVGAGEGPPLPRARLIPSMRAVLVELLAQVRECPVVETAMSVASSNAAMQIQLESTKVKDVRDADATDEDADISKALQLSLQGDAAAPSSTTTASAEEQPPVAGPLPSPTKDVKNSDSSGSRADSSSAMPLSPLTETVDFCKRLLTRARSAQMNKLKPLYSVVPMHPSFVSLGRTPSEGDIRKAVQAAVAGHPGATATSSPSDLRSSPAAADAIAAAIAGSGIEAAANILCEPTASEEDIVSSAVGIDHILIGTLRLASALVEADPVTAREIASGADTAGGSSADATSIIPAVSGSMASPPNASILQVLFHDCLFADEGVPGSPSSTSAARLTSRVPLVGASQAPTGGPKCKSVLARRAAFHLLRAFCRRSPHNTANLLRLMEAQSVRLYDTLDPAQCINVRISTKSSDGVYRLDPAGRDARSSSGYVGLRNLGCICYMNSLMQQFFMMEPLRYGLLSVASHAEGTDPDAAPDKPLVEARKDSILYQVQRMFGHLELSKRRAYSPEAWCHAYKDLDGRATNVLEQQDAQEYLTTLLDRLESELKGSHRAKLIEQVLGLETREVRFCTGGCNTVKTVPQPNVCLSLEVERGTMVAALEQNVAWEDIPGYSCEACGKKTTLRKRNTIGGLGNTLIMHLKRFSMDWETGMPNKINKRFEFPMELDLSPYSHDALSKELQQEGGGGSNAGTPSSPAATAKPREHWQYDLVGVVVHTGELTHGHYYSFIKERGPRAAALAVERAAAAAGGNSSTATAASSDAATSGTFNGRWLEFNDSDVREWDPAHMAAECYGGSTSIKNSATGLSSDVQVYKNAYMLVYERRVPQPVSVEVDAAEAGMMKDVLGRSFPGWEASVDATSSAAAAAGAGGGIGFLSSIAASAKSPIAAAFGAITGTSSPPAASAKYTLSLLPQDIVPRDSYGRGVMPASVVREVYEDNAALGRLCAQLDPEYAYFVHATMDTVARQRTLLPHASPSALSVPLVLLDCDGGDAGSASGASALVAGGKGRGSIGAGAASGVSESKEGAASSSSSATAAPPIDVRTVLRPLFMYTMIILIRSNHVHLVPHAMYNLCRIIGCNYEAAELVAREMVEAEQRCRREGKWKSYATPPKRVLTGIVVLAEMAEIDSWFRNAMCSMANDVVRYAASRVLATTLSVLAMRETAAMTPQPIEHEKNLTFSRPFVQAANAPGSVLADLLQHLLGSYALFDWVTGSAWMVFDPLFAGIYDGVRLGFGSGLPLQLHCYPSDSTAPSDTTSSFAAGVASALSVWCEGRMDADELTQASRQSVADELGLMPDLGVASDSDAAAVVALYRLMMVGLRLRHSIIDRHGLALLVDMHLHDRSPVSWNNRSVRKNNNMSDKGIGPTWTGVFDLAALLWRSSYMPNHGHANGASQVWQQISSGLSVYLGPVPAAVHHPKLGLFGVPVAHSLKSSSADRAALPAAARGYHELQESVTPPTPGGDLVPMAVYKAMIAPGVTTASPSTAAAAGSSSSSAASSPSAVTDAADMMQYWTKYDASWNVADGGVPSTLPPPPSLVPALADVLPQPSPADATIMRRHAVYSQLREVELAAAAQALEAGHQTYFHHGLEAQTKKLSSTGLRAFSPFDQDALWEVHGVAPGGRARPQAGARYATLALAPSAPGGQHRDSIARADLIAGANPHAKQPLAAYRAMLNVLGEEANGSWPGSWGPNAEAMAQMLAHRCMVGLPNFQDLGQETTFQSSIFSHLILKAVAQANQDTCKPLFLSIEAVLCMPEAPPWRDIRAVSMTHLMDRFLGAREKHMAMAMECVNEISRLAMLVPEALKWAIAEGKAEVDRNKAIIQLAEVQLWLLGVIQEGMASGKVPPWQMAVVDPASVSDADLRASTTVGAPFGGNVVIQADVKDLPYKRYLISLVAGNVTHLSVRDEAFAVADSGMHNAVRARIILQRLQRALEVRGLALHTPEYLEEVKLHMASVAAATATQNSGSQASASHAAGAGSSSKHRAQQGGRAHAGVRDDDVQVYQTDELDDSDGTYDEDSVDAATTVDEEMDEERQV